MFFSKGKRQVSVRQRDGSSSEELKPKNRQRQRFMWGWERLRRAEEKMMMKEPVPAVCIVWIIFCLGGKFIGLIFTLWKVVQS